MQHRRTGPKVFSNQTKPQEPQAVVTSTLTTVDIHRDIETVPSYRSELLGCEVA